MTPLPEPPPHCPVSWSPHCKNGTYSTLCMARLTAATVTPLATVYRIRRIYLLLEFDAISPRPSNGPTCFYKVPCRSVSAKSRPETKILLTYRLAGIATTLLKGLSFIKIEYKIKTYVKTGKAVPAKDVLAPLAHHLGAALVLFDRNVAHGAALDQVRVERYPLFLSLALLSQLLAVVLT